MVRSACVVCLLVGRISENFLPLDDKRAAQAGFSCSPLSQTPTTALFGSYFPKSLRQNPANPAFSGGRLEGG
jgi:hypothetical protein